MNHLHIALWGVLPYIVAVVLVAGTAWRYHYDRFGFTTRSSQMHEHRLLSVGGPLFHYGLLFVAAGHVVGLIVPESLTERVHIEEPLYHANALFVGGAAGLATLTGLALLLYRRLKVPAVRAATSRSDRALFGLRKLDRARRADAVREGERRRGNPPHHRSADRPRQPGPRPARRPGRLRPHPPSDTVGMFQWSPPAGRTSSAGSSPAMSRTSSPASASSGRSSY
ncbi:respiratory nitrate reductase subunit gamma [Streptomyces sp. ISL-94]|uniref:respiratory nitrate reductase subunit gamma n=1 Tax=Streptomyces sp. ISL-94 TaxID=2819190 RepID=UPI0027E4DFAF|nr:respiratory nitrate reductase subunit gamma [Streptomyces sp. ISL-94]